VTEHPLAGLRSTVQAPATGGVVLVRHARKDGRPVAVLQLVRHEQHCSVEAQVFPRGSGPAETRRGPYNFSTVAEASSFVDEAVDALTYLGCEIE
jgi:hypothetical protein